MARQSAAGTFEDMSIWRTFDHPQTVIRCGVGDENVVKVTRQGARGTSARRSRAMLFADFKGFSKLGDASISAFSTLLSAAQLRLGTTLLIVFLRQTVATYC